MSCTWQRAPTEPMGILCGCDAEQEWLLPWWWERYSAQHAFPVTFVDFGNMTEPTRAWCAQRGELVTLTLDSGFIKGKAEVPEALAKEWEGFYGQTIWKARVNWFKKPFALLHTCYQVTLWIDLDCEILGYIGALLTESAADLALVREHDSERYNGGVIVYAHGSNIIQKWAEAAMTRSGEFWSDDALLTSLIYAHSAHVVELPEIYNWRLSRGINFNALIHHWVGSAGKAYIKNFGGIKRTLLINGK